MEDTLETDQPVIFFEDIKTRLNLQNIQHALTKERERYSYYDQFRITVNLHIDSQISMKYITQILDELRKSNLRNIQFSTGRRYSQYPDEDPSFKY